LNDLEIKHFFERRKRICFGSNGNAVIKRFEKRKTFKSFMQ